MQNSENCIVILHISDLHFEHGKTAQDVANQLYVFDRLLDLLNGFDSAWRPDLLCITGDITYKNKSKGYKQASIWIKKLLTELSIEKNGVFICPGNHEIDRNEASVPGIIKLKELDNNDKTGKVDDILSIPLAGEYKKLFHNYEDFCKELNLLPYSFNGKDEFVIGNREYKNIRFICNNSCWFTYEKNEIWFGKNFLKQLLPNEINIDTPITIGLTHHPRDFYNDNEKYMYLDRHPPVTYFSERCHLILTGHAHARPGAVEIYAKARWFNAGCCGQSDQYRNNFTLIKIWPQKKIMDYRRYEWDGGQNKWIFFDEESDYDFDYWNRNENKLFKRIEAKPARLEEKSEIEIREDLKNLFQRIKEYVFSLDYALAIKAFEDNQNIIDSKYADQSLKTEINLLISEAKNE